MDCHGWVVGERDTVSKLTGISNLKTYLCEDKGVNYWESKADFGVARKRERGGVKRLLGD